VKIIIKSKLIIKLLQIANQKNTYKVVIIKIGTQGFKLYFFLRFNEYRSEINQVYTITTNYIYLSIKEQS
jgi:hypothetical protein